MAKKVRLRKAKVYPEVTAILLCDGMGKDPNGKVTLYGLFNRILFTETPIVVRFLVFIRLLGGSGEHDIRLTVSTSRGKTLLDMQLEMEKEIRSGKKIDLYVQINNLEVPKPGKYNLALLSGKKTLVETVFPVEESAKPAEAKNGKKNESKPDSEMVLRFTQSDTSAPNQAASLSSGDIVERSDIASAEEVAAYMIQLAAAEDEPDYLTHMRLQKLLYYVQGWSLAIRNCPMFSEKIEAWAHGPVVKDLYPKLAGFENRPIMPEDFPVSGHIGKGDQEFISSVWEAYKVYSATSLRKMSHDERPWKDARRGFAPADRCENEISKEAMKDFFTEAANRE